MGHPAGTKQGQSSEQQKHKHDLFSDYDLTLWSIPISEDAGDLTGPEENFDGER